MYILWVYLLVYTTHAMYITIGIPNVSTIRINTNYILYLVICQVLHIGIYCNKM